MAAQAIPSEDAETEIDIEETATEVDEETPSEVENPEILILKEQNAALLADLQRVQAEFENFRRQNAKRQADLVEQAGGTLAEKLLPVLDACDAGIQQGLEDVIPVRNALIETLQGEGLEVVAHSGVEFDPERHDAIMHEAKEDSDKTTVDEIMRSGYLWKGRTIRPAMVRTIGPA